jgi:hypothetical protein
MIILKITDDQEEFMERNRSKRILSAMSKMNQEHSSFHIQTKQNMHSSASLCIVTNKRIEIGFTGSFSSVLEENM